MINQDTRFQKVCSIIYFNAFAIVERNQKQVCWTEYSDNWKLEILSIVEGNERQENEQLETSPQMAALHAEEEPDHAH